MTDSTYRYPDTEHDALSGVSFEVGPGETLALVGAGGAGKSMIAELLLRAHDGATAGAPAPAPAEP